MQFLGLEPGQFVCLIGSRMAGVFTFVFLKESMYVLKELLSQLYNLIWALE